MKKDLRKKAIIVEYNGEKKRYDSLREFTNEQEFNYQRKEMYIKWIIEGVKRPLINQKSLKLNYLPLELG